MYVVVDVDVDVVVSERNKTTSDHSDICIIIQVYIRTVFITTIFINWTDLDGIVR